jgi:transposase-like protein
MSAAERRWFEDRSAARDEHAYRLRQEKLKLHQIGERLGVTKQRAAQMVAKHTRARLPTGACKKDPAAAATRPGRSFS